MTRPTLPLGMRSAPQSPLSTGRRRGFLRGTAWCAAGMLLAAGMAAQVVTVDSHTGAVINGPAGQGVAVDRRYQQIEPTRIPLPNSELDAKTRTELIGCCSRNRASRCAHFRAATGA